MSSQNARKGNDHSENEEDDNFLQVKAHHNEITGDLSEMTINVDQLYISWNISIFNKLLQFFFYSSEQGDAPTVATGEKKPLKINFNMNRFYLYCFHEETQLIGLVKLHFIEIRFYQNPNE